MSIDPSKSISVALERVWVEILFYFGFIFPLWLSCPILFLWDSIVGGGVRKKNQTQNNSVEFTHLSRLGHLSGWPRKKVLGKILITWYDELGNKSLSVLDWHGSLYCVSLSPDKGSQMPDSSESHATKSKTHCYLTTQSQTGSSFPGNASLRCSHLLGGASNDLGLFIRKSLHHEGSFLSCIFQHLLNETTEALRSTCAHWPFCTKTTPSIFELLQDGSWRSKNLRNQ